MNHFVESPGCLGRWRQGPGVERGAPECGTTWRGGGMGWRIYNGWRVFFLGPKIWEFSCVLRFPTRLQRLIWSRLQRKLNFWGGPKLKCGDLLGMFLWFFSIIATFLIRLGNLNGQQKFLSLKVTLFPMKWAFTDLRTLIFLDDNCNFSPTCHRRPDDDSDNSFLEFWLSESP